MKIKLKVAYGAEAEGTVVEAVLSHNKLSAVFYDRNNSHWFVSDYEFQIQEDPPEKKEALTILSAIGGEIKKLNMDVEFK